MSFVLNRNGLKIRVSTKALITLLIGAAFVWVVWFRPHPSRISLLDLVAQPFTSPIASLQRVTSLWDLIDDNPQKVQQACRELWDFYARERTRQGTSNPFIPILIPDFSTTTTKNQSQAATVGNSFSATFSSANGSTFSSAVTAVRFTDVAETAYDLDVRAWAMFLESNKDVLSDPAVHHYVSDVESFKFAAGTYSDTMKIDSQLSKMARMSKKDECAMLKAVK